MVLNTTMTACLTSAALAIGLVGFSGNTIAQTAATDKRTQAPTALDMAQQFMQFGSDITEADVRSLFNTGVQINTEIDAEHLGVAVIDTRTGERVTDEELRNTIGPTYLNGSDAVIQSALKFGGDAAAFDADQLDGLTVAAFLASMRNPPQHLQVEYYDKRNGLTGDFKDLTASTANMAPQMANQTATGETTGEAIVPPEETYMPSDRAEIVAHFRNHNLLVERREGMMAIPFMVGAYDQDLLGTFLQRSIGEFSDAYPVEFVEVAKHFDDSPVSSVYRRSAIVYFSGSEQVLSGFAQMLGKDFYLE